MNSFADLCFTTYFIHDYYYNWATSIDTKADEIISEPLINDKNDEEEKPETPVVKPRSAARKSLLKLMAKRKSEKAESTNKEDVSTSSNHKPFSAMFLGDYGRSSVSSNTSSNGGGQRSRISSLTRETFS